LGAGCLPRLQPAGVSHDSKDAPNFTHKIFTVHWSYINQKIIAIQDDDRTHYPFLKQWSGMEIDINNQWSVNNGTLGMEVILHNAGKHEMKYLVKLKTEDAQRILDSKYNVVGIINEQKRLIYVFVPLNIHHLREFLDFKIDTDNMIKKKHLSPKGWTIQ